MQNQLTNLTDLITKFMNSNTASTSSSGTLPSNTIANLKSNLKAITTQSGVSYDGPQLPPLVVENKPEATKDTVNLTNNKNTKDVQPQAVQSKYPVSTEPTIAPGSASKPNPKALIPYPSRRNDKRNREKANNRIEKFYQIFKDMSMAECLALEDLSASINLMPLSVWKRLSLPDLTPTCMTLKLADHSISHPVRVAEDVYVKEVLGFSDTISSGNPTPFHDLIVSATSPTLTSFGNSDFLLEEVDAFLAIEDEPTSSQFHQSYLDPDGDILILEAFLNDDPSLPLLIKEIICLKFARNLKSVKLKPTNLQLMNPQQFNSKLYLPTSNMHSRKMTTSHLPVHCVPNKGGFTVVENKDNELISTRLVTGWRVCIDYRKLNEATQKDQFPLPFMDQMPERLTGNQYYCFLDGFYGYFQIPIDPKDQEKATFTCPYETFAYRRMPFGYAMLQARFRGARWQFSMI
uniref:Reverse transcriptase domain-containing protein n=1 Tax=Tanacetum cinerariifolium TaxID=118510 RepID=A0A699KA34_TANCI|nr:reverse transcriptase domain-containing protein [Tanacetum cinerariifolium]